MTKTTLKSKTASRSPPAVSGLTANVDAADEARFTDVLDGLLATWGRAPHPEIADLIDRASDAARTPTPGELRGKTRAANAAWHALADRRRAADVPGVARRAARRELGGRQAARPQTRRARTRSAHRRRAPGAGRGRAVARAGDQAGVDRDLRPAGRRARRPARAAPRCAARQDPRERGGDDGRLAVRQDRRPRARVRRDVLARTARPSAEIARRALANRLAARAPTRAAPRPRRVARGRVRVARRRCAAA